MASRLLLWLPRLALVPLLAFWGAVVFRIVNVPENYIGWSPLWGLPLLAAILTLAVLAWLRTKATAALVIAMLAASSMIALYLIDHFSVLTSYESWLARGMPTRPF